MFDEEKGQTDRRTKAKAMDQIGDDHDEFVFEKNSGRHVEDRVKQFDDQNDGRNLNHLPNDLSTQNNVNRPEENRQDEKGVIEPVGGVGDLRTKRKRSKRKTNDVCVEMWQRAERAEQMEQSQKPTIDMHC